MNRIDRLFALVLQLQAHGRRRAQDLAAEFEVSLRTIYRDVQALSEAGVPVVALPGQGYSLSEGYFLPPLMFTGLEAGALALGADYIAKSLDAPFRAAAESAQAKLGNALTAESRRELRQVQESIRFVQAEMSPIHKHLKELREAIVGRRLLKITYHTYGKPAPQDRLVEPYGLLNFGHTWQLLAYCRLREGPRMFRLDRIDNATLLEEHFERSNDRQPRPEQRGVPDQEHEVLVGISTEKVRWIQEEKPFGLVGERTEGEKTILTFHVRDQERLARWLMKWADDAEVISPDKLRRRMHELGSMVVSRHEKGSVRGREDISDRA
jgi:predicted DNA-binding transcriptional regulator YafY